MEEARGNLGSAVPEDPDRLGRFADEGHRLGRLELQEEMLDP